MYYDSGSWQSIAAVSRQLLNVVVPRPIRGRPTASFVMCFATYPRFLSHMLTCDSAYVADSSPYRSFSRSENVLYIDCLFYDEEDPTSSVIIVMDSASCLQHSAMNFAKGTLLRLGNTPSSYGFST